MEFNLKSDIMRAFTCAILLLLAHHQAFTSATEMNEEHTHNQQSINHTDENNIHQNESQQIQRRQGFDFMSYFMKKNAQSQPQQTQAAQQPDQLQPQASQIQQQHLLQQQLLQEQQRRQLEQLQNLQQQQILQQQQTPHSESYQNQLQQLQQLIQLQKQQRTPPADAYQQQEQQYQPQVADVHREGGYGQGYSQGYDSQPRQIGVNIGGKPIVQVGSILPLLPRIFNVLNAGGKVMFGVELGNNFYFGPVGAKPLG
ncbi:hypothetical protein JTE90_013284 [Oedothorax gibbosus]|uniref:Uncharacterized protein n=1 Tax=Oedothorax gibbosus TaxID=931172 RepID=A0AAV6VFP3_9ARAC|nr:hypothetical protein JTE90_013284 [Oedothorax gibbosus]